MRYLQRPVGAVDEGLFWGWGVQGPRVKMVGCSSGPSLVVRWHSNHEGAPYTGQRVWGFLGIPNFRRGMEGHWVKLKGLGDSLVSCEESDQRLHIARSPFLSSQDMLQFWGRNERSSHGVTGLIIDPQGSGCPLCAGCRARMWLPTPDLSRLGLSWEGSWLVLPLTVWSCSQLVSHCS